MTWRDDLRRVELPDGRILVGASFRGVAFFVESSERTGGRRAVTHEFPYRDDPFVEDTGRRARSFRVEGYVVGDAYVRDRDALIAALEDTAGPGKLVHPYHGVRRAVCNGLTIRETRNDGGMAVFQVEFVEAPATAALAEAPDLASAVSAQADDAAAAAEAEFTDDYDVAGQPAWAVESLAAELAASVEELQASLSDVKSSIQETAQLSAEVRSVSAQASSIIREPMGIVESFKRAVRSVATAVEASPRPVLRALVDVHSWSQGQAVAILGVTQTREQERANLNALRAVLRRVLAIEAARTITQVDYETVELALTDRADVAAILEAEAAEAGNAAYPALVSLRSRVLQAVPGDAALARVVTVERRQATPSLLLAYQLYGSTEREADLVARNQVQHPGFMAGTLTVLSHV